MMEQTDNLIKLSNGQVLSKETIDGDIATINFGPTHPATHGIFQNILTVDGEKILTSVQTVGYIHRAFEKLAERRPYNQITPITDRLNYCSSPINNLGWHMTVEKLLQVEELILPLLSNLMKNPEKEYILWPNRDKKIKQFKAKIKNIYEGK